MDFNIQTCYHNLMKMIVSILIPQVIGGLGAFFTAPAIPSWYATLKKPFFQPPNWLFGPVWTILYLLMGVSFYLIWTKTEDQASFNQARNVFILQLALNFLWSALFFGLKSPGLALLEIIYLWLVILVNLVVFFRLSRPAGLLFVPYLAWVSFASILNLSVFLLNR